MTPAAFHQNDVFVSFLLCFFGIICFLTFVLLDFICNLPSKSQMCLASGYFNLTEKYAATLLNAKVSHITVNVTIN
jgi:hypothetical protein